MVWDRILDRDGRSHPVEEWGGVAYAISALRAALPPSWTVLPIVKVGRDLSEQAFHFLREIPGVDVSAVVVVPEANNRVELRYSTADRRTERLTGGVPPWSWPELALPLDLCDALYVNFISGFEMELDIDSRCGATLARKSAQSERRSSALASKSRHWWPWVRR